MREVQQFLNMLPSLPRIALWLVLGTMLVLWLWHTVRSLKGGKVGASAHDIFYVCLGIAALYYAKAI